MFNFELWRPLRGGFNLLLVFISVHSPAVPTPVAAGGSIFITLRNFMPKVPRNFMPQVPRLMIFCFENRDFGD